MQNNDFIEIINASQNNLKNISLKIPKNKFTVVTGLSGSGKSSLVFDTIYAEANRRYIQSMSSYVRQILDIQDKPIVDSISGLSPAIAIDQKSSSKNPRSTVGTATEVYDYIRLLFARIGDVHSPSTGKIIRKYHPADISTEIENLPLGTKIRISSPIIKNKKGDMASEISQLKEKGYSRIKVNNKLIEISEIQSLTEDIYNIEVIVDRVIIKEGISSRIINAIENSYTLSDGSVIIDIVELPKSNNDTFFYNEKIKNNDSIYLSNKFECPISNFTLDEIEPRIFSFNSPFGACPKCNGIGYEKFFKEDLVIPDKSLSLLEGAIHPWKTNPTRHNNAIIFALAKKFKFDPTSPFENLNEKVQKLILYSEDEIMLEIEDFDSLGKVNKLYKKFTGVIKELELQINQLEDSVLIENLEKYQSYVHCRECNGYKLKKSSLAVKINNVHIGEVCSLDISELITWCIETNQILTGFKKEVSKLIFKEIITKLNFLINVGLNYLTLNRSSNTLSGGEAQRIRLASQIGSGLSGVIYVLDEPSIGLHQSDNHKLINTIKSLRDIGNTIIVVEHDEDTMLESDYLIDIGPYAGKYGGELIAAGTPEEVKNNHNSITGNFLSGKDSIEVPLARRRYGKNSFIEIKNARENNLKNVDFKLPLGMFVAVCGVSGGGKSTLVIDILYNVVAQHLNGMKVKGLMFDSITGIENINKIIKIDQSPIGRTPRSNPATYVGLFSLVRDLFTNLIESRSRGYKSGRFSFNVKGGRCENCQGDGLIKVEMQFLPDIYVNCDICKGKRYNKETLEIQYKGYSIADILDMTVKEAYDVFNNIPAIAEKLKSLINVGLDYIKLGQSATSLSGGEAQRIKLSKELSKRATGDTLYILDEPTTGLHSYDIKKLLAVLHQLVDFGNTVLVIEHNLDVIKTADFVVDIGPKGGKEGGQIVAQGTPEIVALNPNSVTGPFLKKLLPKLNKNG